MKSSPAHEVRLQCRNGSLTILTPRLVLGHVQANLLILPSAYDSDFHDLCARNPVPCPLLASSDIVGNPQSIDNKSLIDSIHDFDIRTDLPKYNVYLDRKPVDVKTDAKKEWIENHAAFLIGCSFSFEKALDAAGLTPRHWEMNSNVAMYMMRMNLAPAGKFDGGYWVVSMRPYKEVDIQRVRDTTRRFRGMHGEPLAWGWSAVSELGIADIAKQEFGDAVEIKDGEVPVFWGCGVTPQIAAVSARIPGIVIAHSPGHMLVLDSMDSDFK